MSDRNFIQGEERVVFVKPHATTDTYGKRSDFATADVVQLLDSGQNLTREEIPIDDNNFTRSQLQMVGGDYEGAVEYSGYLRVDSGRNNPPNIHPFVTAMMGTGTWTGSANAKSGAYSLQEDVSNHRLDVLEVYDEGEFTRCAHGIFLTSFNMPGTLEGLINWTCSGMARYVSECTKGAKVKTVISAATKVVSVKNPENLDLWSYVKIGTNDNGGKGFRIEKITYGSSGSITLDADVTSAAVDAVIDPFYPSVTIPATDCIVGADIGFQLKAGKSQTLAAADYRRTTGFDITLENAIAGRRYSRTAAGATGSGRYFSDNAHDGNRNVTVSFTDDLTSEEIAFRNRIIDEQHYTLALIYGVDTAGHRFTFKMPNVRFNLPNSEIGATGIGTFGPSGQALGISGEDELTALA